MGSKRQRKRKTQAALVDRIVGPTEAREAHNDIGRTGSHYRIKPVIDTLLEARKLTHAEYDCLQYYRDQAHRAEDDCAQGSTLDPERIMGGGGGSFGSKIPANLLATPAIIETARIERDMGGLWEIARRVAVDDWTLTRWCIDRHGGRERYDGKGKFVAMVPICEKRVMAAALLDLRYAARSFGR